MKIKTIKKRISKNRTKVEARLPVPTDVIDDLKKVAKVRGFSGYRGLARGAGLREDLERLEQQMVGAVKTTNP